MGKGGMKEQEPKSARSQIAIMIVAIAIIGTVFAVAVSVTNGMSAKREADIVAAAESAMEAVKAEVASELEAARAERELAAAVTPGEAQLKAMDLADRRAALARDREKALESIGVLAGLQNAKVDWGGGLRDYKFDLERAARGLKYTRDDDGEALGEYRRLRDLTLDDLRQRSLARWDDYNKRYGAQ